MEPKGRDLRLLALEILSNAAFSPGQQREEQV